MPKSSALETPSEAATEQVTRATANAESLFDRDRFLLHQKHFSLTEKYKVFDESGRPILFVRRDRRILRQVLSLTGAIATFLVFGVAAVLIGDTNDFRGMSGILAAVVAGLGLIVCIMVAVLIAPKRHITFSTNEAMTDEALTVLQDNKFQVYKAHFTIADADLNLLGWATKNYLYTLFRSRWYLHGSDGAILSIVQEDSLWKAIFRRVLRFADLPFMRTNYTFFGPDGRSRFGAFNRKFTLFDKYVIDMSEDSGRAIDRRLAVAMGVLLDTGERR